MLRSLFAGISGLRVNQTMLDVTGNNIANANTTGFKASTTVFQDTLSQMLTGAAAPQAGVHGGTNPIQIGLGVQVAATEGNFNQGSAEMTGRPTDLMLQGDGFFWTKNGSQDLYTRAGSFAFDNNGDLVTPDGNLVQGYPADSTGTVPVDASGQPTGSAGKISIDPAALATQLNLPTGTTLQSYNIGSDGMLRGVFSDGSQHDIAQLAIANFVNPMGLEKVGETSFRASANSGKPQNGVAGTGGHGTIMAGALEMSNVDLAAEFTNLILAQRGFQASSKVITTSDQVLQDLVNIKQ